MAQLGPPLAPALAPAPPAPHVTSVIPVHVEVGLDAIRRRIEAEAPKRVAEEHNRDIGGPGRLTYTIDRGPFSVGLDGTRFVVATDLRINAEVCKPLGLLGCAKYASCDPVAKVSARLPLELTPEYAFSPAEVRLDFSRRCLVTALDIDVTPMLDERAKGETRAIEQKINASLPRPRDEAQRLYGLLGKTTPIKGTGCMGLSPLGIVQGAPTVRGGALDVRIGIVAAPFVGPSCPKREFFRIFPALRRDPKLADEFDLNVAVRVPTETIDKELAASLVDKDVIGGDGLLRIRSVKAHPTAQGLLLELGVSGSACGTLFVLATPEWDDKMHAIGLKAKPFDGELERLRAMAPALDLKLFANNMAALAQIAPLLDDEAIKSSLEGFALPVGDGGATFEIALRQAKGGRVDVAPEGLVARLHAMGRATLHLALK